MSAPFAVSECRECGYVAYPPRILCPRCASSSWKRRLTENGIVTEVTTRRPVAKRRQLPSGNWLDQDATRLAAVQSDAGVRIIARVSEDVEVGDRVRLVSQASTVIALPGHVVEAQRLDPSGAGSDVPALAPLSDRPGRG
ncbi:MAG TPA: zinc ribbon domain-containing protein [Capillimicrobium sp.]